MAEQAANNETIADTESSLNENQSSGEAGEAESIQERSAEAPSADEENVSNLEGEKGKNVPEVKELSGEQVSNEESAIAEETSETDDQKSENKSHASESFQSKSSKKSNIGTPKNESSASTSNSKYNTNSKKEEEFCAKISNHSSNMSLMCRICYDDTLDEPIISPCKCKGSVGMMHKSCLEKWLAESNTNRCDLCFHRFETERTTKFGVYQSIYRWLRYPPSSFAFPIRDMRSDMITCLVLIPFSFLLIYLCLFAAEYYNRQNFSMIPVARWTAISVMFMGIVIVLGFCAWIYLVLRYHSRVWYFWWQRETIVRIHVKAVPDK